MTSQVGVRVQTGLTQEQRLAWEAVKDSLAVLDAWKTAEERCWIAAQEAEHQGPAPRAWASARLERCQEQIRAAQKGLDRVRSHWEAIRPGEGHQ